MDTQDLMPGLELTEVDKDDNPPAKSWSIDTADTHRLKLKIDATLFFQDNELSTPIMRGYTLPGFKLCPTVGYQPSGRVKMQMGVYLMRFWGADSYPNLSYSDISEWTGKEDAAKGFHLLPFFRVQLATEGGVNFVLGSIYGGRHHRLMRPLYARELYFTADPEAGAQVLYSNKWLDFDSWINWESFIYRNDTHQEAFTFGVSSRLKYNREESELHIYSPVQILFQHRGGEIDTLQTNSVQTLFNGAAGIGARWNINHRAIRALAVEADALVYNQQVGDLYPFDSGWAWYAHTSLDVANVRATAGYFQGDKFLSLMGYPFYGGVSLSTSGLTFDKTRLAYAGVDFRHEFAPGFTLGAEAMVYRHLAGTGVADGVARGYGASTSFYGALYVRVDPAFVLKSLR